MSYHLLIVEDSREFRTILELALEPRVKEGLLKLSFTTNGVEALELIRRHPSISLLLTDISMPQMDGLTLLEQVNAHNPHIKSIVISAHSNFDFLRRAMNAGASDYLVKPVMFDDILESIDRIVRRVDIVREALSSRDRLKKFERELDIAHDIQQEMLPRPFAETRTEFDIKGSMLPARQIGGDFYDYFQIDDDKLGFVIGDVSGKGVSAALLMARIRTLVRSHAMHGVSPAECLTHVNEAIAESNKQAMFATVFLGYLNLSSGRLTYCNASHVNPVLRTASGECAECCDSHAMAVGMLAESVYRNQELMLAAGDSLVLVTDGITDAHNEQEERYGYGRVLSSIAGHGTSVSANEILSSLVHSVMSFASSSEQFDDIGVLVVTYNGTETVWNDPRA